jgi:hypothetical protein
VSVWCGDDVDHEYDHEHVDDYEHDLYFYVYFVYFVDEFGAGVVWAGYVSEAVIAGCEAQACASGRACEEAEYRVDGWDVG